MVTASLREDTTREVNMVTKIFFFIFPHEGRQSVWQTIQPYYRPALP